ncbi:hypothetical protein ACJMK2_040614, partial [Sinanodonta woodiana]
TIDSYYNPYNPVAAAGAYGYSSPYSYLPTTTASGSTSVPSSQTYVLDLPPATNGADSR